LFAYKGVVAGACVFAYGGLSFGGDPVRAIALLHEVLSGSEVVRVKEQVIAALADLLSSEEAG
jgi:hypothetical protein